MAYGMVVALATAAGAAHATVDLDAAGTVGTVRISAETLSTAADRTVVVDGETYHRISTRAADLQVEGQVGIRGAAGRQVFIRLQFNNMVFAAAAADATVRIPDRDTATTGSQAQALTLEAGGAVGSSHVVYSAPAGTVISQDAIVRAALHGHLAILPDRPGNISQTTYLDLADAFNGRRPLAAKQKTAVRTVRSLATTVTPGTVTATVASGFTKLAAAGPNRIGALNIRVGGFNVDAQSGVEVTDFDQVAQAGSVTLRGDFSVGVFSVNTAAAAACGATPLAMRDAEGDVLEQVTLPAAAGITALCIDMPDANTNAIAEGEYTVAVEYQGLANAAIPPRELAETTIGRISRMAPDRTRVQIPVLSTYSGHIQRVVIVNRNPDQVSYAFTFTPQGRARATAGEMAEGTVPANSRVLLRTTDIVTLSGKVHTTQTAATLDVVATNGTVDVATTQMHLESQGTDTVIY